MGPCQPTCESSCNGSDDRGLRSVRITASPQRVIALELRCADAMHECMSGIIIGQSYSSLDDQVMEPSMMPRLLIRHELDSIKREISKEEGAVSRVQTPCTPTS